MANRLYYKSSKILKKYYFIFLVILLIVLAMIIPIPYIIEAPGGLIDLDDRVIIEYKYDSKGSLNLTYVSQMKGNIFKYLMSKVNTNWDAYEIDTNKKESNDIMNHLLLENSYSNAEYVAYNALGKEISIINSNFFVAYISDEAETDLVVGDEILEVNGIKLESLIDYENAISSSRVGDKLNVKTKDKEKYIEVKEIDNSKNTLIYLICNNKYETEVKYAFQENENGSSGGLMVALSIYDKLTEVDLTKGKIIAGTGTIDINGVVGEISGIKYKIAGAVENGAEVFLVPKDNYVEARRVVKLNHYDIDLISIETFNDALNYLEKSD